MDPIILSDEQVKAINYDQAGAYAIKGIAGSGKTTVGLHRIPFLLDKCNNDESVLVVTYHKVLVNYLKHLSEKNQLNGNYKGIDGNRCEIVNIDSLVFEKYKDFRQNNYNNPYYKKLPDKMSDPKELKEVFNHVLEYIRKSYPTLEILKNSNIKFLQEEVDYINQCRINTIKDYQVFTRSGRSQFTDNRRNLLKKSKAREAIFKIRNKYNNELISLGMMDWQVMRLLALREVMAHPPKRFTHLIIDECQDMDRTRMDFIKHFINDGPGASATFLYDNTQSIYNASWLGNGHGFNSLGIDIKGKSKLLKKNYRTTYEIQEAAQSLLADNQLIKQEIEPILINRSGTKPFWAHCDNFDHQVEYICDVIKTHNANFELKDIIIAVRTNDEVKKLNNALAAKEIQSGILSASDNSFAFNQVRVMTMHSSKGLESEVVIIANLNEGLMPISTESDSKFAQELKLLYVGMTRASKHLYLTSFGTPSVFLSKISPSTITKIDFNTYEGYQKVVDPKIKSEINALFTRLENTLKNYPSFRQNVENRDDYISRSTEMMIKQHELFTIHFELEQLREKVPANTSTHAIFMNLWGISEKKLQTAQQEQRKFIHNPIDFKELLANLKERFLNLKDESIHSIATIEYHLKMEDLTDESDLKDWGPFFTCYSKAIEIELERIIKKYKFNFYKINPVNNKNMSLSLKDMLDELASREFPFNHIVKMLDKVDFRYKRNTGTHNGIMRPEDIWPIQKMMMKEDGILNHMNKLLA